MCSRSKKRATKPSPGCLLYCLLVLTPLGPIANRTPLWNLSSWASLRCGNGFGIGQNMINIIFSEAGCYTLGHCQRNKPKNAHHAWHVFCYGILTQWLTCGTSSRAPSGPQSTGWMTPPKCNAPYKILESNGSVDSRHRLLQRVSFGTSCNAVLYKTNSSSNFHSLRAAAFAKLRFAEKDLPTVPTTVGPGKAWRLENHQMKHHQHRLTCLVMLLWLPCLTRMTTPPMPKETVVSQYRIPFSPFSSAGGRFGCQPGTGGWGNVVAIRVMPPCPFIFE